MPNIDLASFAASQGIKIYGEVSGGSSGFSASSIVDVNGDGFSDMIISAPDAYSYSGVSYLIFGKSAADWTNIDLSTLAFPQGIKIYSAVAEGRVGFSVSGAGDINGDGFGDIIIAAPNAYNYLGMSYLIWGKSTGWTNIDLASLTTEQGISFTNDENGNGDSVSGIGDVNNDGYDDLIIGGYSNSNRPGTCYLIFGKSIGWADVNLTTLTTSVGITIQGVPDDASTGASVSGAGDVNGDGYDDFLIGAPYVNALGRTNSGQVYLIFGKATGWTNIDLNGLTNAQGIKIHGTTFAYIHEVNGAGDINGDGYDDFLIGGTPVYLVFGKPTGWIDIDLTTLTTSVGITIYGSDDTGIFISGTKDINGDGYDDILIGATQADPFGRTDAGESYLIFGKPTGWTNIYLNALTNDQGIVIYGANAGDFSGAVHGIGDISNDGHNNFLIGAWRASPFGRTNAGESYLIFGESLITPPPTSTPSINPTITPTADPLKVPSISPTLTPTTLPTILTTSPTESPTNFPTTLTSVPTESPTNFPTTLTGVPTESPTIPTIVPTEIPTEAPLYKQDWFWGAVGAGIAFLALIITTGTICYKCSHGDESIVVDHMDLVF